MPGKKSNPIQAPDEGLEIRHSINDSLGLDPNTSKSGMHFYIVLLQSVATVLIAFLGSKKEKHKKWIRRGTLREITNKINPNASNSSGTVVQNEIREIPNKPFDHFGYTDPKDNEAILKHLFKNSKQKKISKQNIDTINKFKEDNDIK